MASSGQIADWRLTSDDSADVDVFVNIQGYSRNTEKRVQPPWRELRQC